MKNLIIVTAVMALSLVALSFTQNKEVINSQPVPENAKYEVPDDVQSIIDNSCYGCHNSDSKSTKGKLKLKFDKMPDMKTGKLVSKLSKISKVLNKGKMPPKKFLEHNPEEALSKQEIETLVSWADGLKTELSGE